jgi:divalent metal cation (Fe/Co/Zn/Cd) transporter
VLESHPQLLCLIHLRTQHLGSDEFLVAAKVELDPSLSLPDAARVIDEGQARVRERAPAARVIYIEPDIVSSGGEAPLTQ